MFLDRDGTIIVERDYLSDPDEVVLIDGVAEALSEARAAGYALVIVTNQSGIGRGYFSWDDYRAIETRVESLLDAAGASVDATYVCPHDPSVLPACSCRKPATGLYVEAAAALDLDVASSWFVGDKESDVLPASAMGGRAILVRTGYGGELQSGAPTGVLVADDLRTAIDEILGSDSR